MRTTHRIVPVAIVVLVAACFAGCAQPPVATPGGDRITANMERSAEATARVEAELLKILPKVQFPGIGFGDVIQFFRDVSNLNIHPKWEALRAANIDEKTQVNVMLTNVSIESALRTVLDDVGGVNPLQFIIDDGIITISTKDDLSRQTLFRTYDVSDLAGPWTMTPIERGRVRAMLRDVMLKDVPATRKPNAGDFRATLATHYDGRVNELAAVVHQAFRRYAADDFADLIRSHVEPEAWRSTGGMIATIRVYDKRLIVTATPPMHRRIEWLLTDLRQTKRP